MPRTQPPVNERLEQLLRVEEFPPPPDFAAHAQVRDQAVYEKAAADGPAWWAEQARRRLDWETPFSAVLDDSSPPFYTWFADGRLNASYNCLDRHVRAGHGDRVAFHWRGEEGEERDVTYAELHADVQRLANGLKARGVRKGDVVGIYLPMIPEVVVAMLTCARIGAPHNVIFGGFAPGSVRERLEVSDAKALITADGARRKGKTADVKAAVDKGIADPARAHDRGRRTGHRIAVPNAARPGCLVRRAARERGPRLPGRADGGRAPAVPAVLIGVNGQAEGHRAHHRGIPDRRRHDHRDGVRPGSGA